MIIKTCKGCKYKKRCNGKTAKNSMHCRQLRKQIPIKKTYKSFLHKFRGLTKDVIYEKYLSSFKRDNDKKP